MATAGNITMATATTTAAEPSLVTVDKLDAAAADLRAREALPEALECMERALVLRQHFYGAESDQVAAACVDMTEVCNILAMGYLQQADREPRMRDAALGLLQKAEVLSRNDDRGRAVTYNNMGCLYKREGRHKAALTYLLKAQTIEARLPDAALVGMRPADTLLNLCAVLSTLGRHDAALEQAQSALILLQEELLSASESEAAGGEAGEKSGAGADDTSDEQDGEAKRVSEAKEVATGGGSGGGEDGGEGEGGDGSGDAAADGKEADEDASSSAQSKGEGTDAGIGAGDGAGDGASTSTSGPDKFSVLAIAYHNVGVEQEFLGRPERALQAYRKGVKVATKYLDRRDAVAVALKRSYLGAYHDVERRARDGAGGAEGANGAGFDAVLLNKRNAGTTPLRRQPRK